MRYIFVLSLLIAGIHLPAQNPGSDAVFEKIVKEYTLQEDGTIDYHYYKRLKLLTHYSFNRLYGETFIVFNPGYQELKINLSKTTHEDGKVTHAPVNAFNEVLPRFAGQAPYYNHLREMVVTHPGTEVGAVIELDYNLITQPGYYPGLMACEILTETSPVMDEEIIIRVPEGHPFNYRVLNLRTAPEITSEGKNQVYTFQFNGIREDSHEAHQPLDNSHLPGLMFSTLTWEEALTWVFEHTSFDHKTNVDMQETVKAIRKDHLYDLPFILALNKLVAGEMNNYRVPWQYAGYKARPPIDTWQSNGGTPFEKSLLFTSLLREIGIHAEPVAVIPSALFDEKIGCLPLVSDFLVQVNPRELEQMYLSTSHTVDQNLIFELSGNTLITLNPGKIRRESIDEDFKNSVITNGTVTMDDSLKISGMIEVMLTEAANPYYAIEKDSASVKTLIKGVPGKAIHSFKVINSAQYRSLADFIIQMDKAPEPLAQYYFFDIPENSRGTAEWHLNYLHSERNHPMQLPFVVDEQYSYELTLPEKATLVNPVELTEIKTGFGELVLSTEQKGNKITVKRLLVIEKETIEITEYNDFKRMFDLWNEENFRKLIIRMD